MFKRKLLALDYPQPETFNTEDENYFRNFIVWLEDQKIRHYKIEERTGLRNMPSSDWTKHFQKYLEDLGCPYQQSQRSLLIDWILGYSVRLEYGDNVDQYKTVTPEKVTQSKAPPGVSSNPLDNLDFDDPDFKAGIQSLSMILKVPPYQDHLEQLKAICLVVKDRLSKEALEKAEKYKEDNIEHLELEKTSLGFDTGDYIINEAAKILRLIHIRDLRDLQNQINQAIVAVQALIANPKTDSRLGKVGRM
ncbi:RNA transcription, translation and transport factor protein-like [Mytilus californianus]|uniref:RNA transcription, translation and transport factor protein-like n=1 Tax=Mytilus californianus TaxID=6549 RepID=UPI0022486342|nr:RNA transcription, translation and transport factor protein-like [Mytilus californianus]